MKISLDFHGVIDALPQLFSFLSRSIIKEGGEVHIVTGAHWDEHMISKLKEFNIIYTHHFSIVDYHHSINTPTTGLHPKYGFPMIDDTLWDKTKAIYCQENNIDLHIDDTTIYSDHFTTPFARLWTKNNHPKPNHKDPRHLI